MFLTEPLLRLPIRFDATRLAAEIGALPEAAWVPHPNRLPGNEAVRLVTPNGEMTERTDGDMAPTEYLRACPYMMQIMEAIGSVWGRGRLMRLSEGAVVPPHIDTKFYWRTHLRIHVPIVTSPDVSFTVRGKTVNMAPGECWVFDTFSIHQVHNGAPHSRTHLVIDTVGSDALWELIDRARASGESAPPLMVPPRDTAEPAKLEFEKPGPPSAMSPWELRYHVSFMAGMTEPEPQLPAVLRLCDRLIWGWNGVWASHGGSEAGVPAYAELIDAFERDVAKVPMERLRLRNTQPLARHIAELVYTVRETLGATGSALVAATVASPTRRDDEEHSRFRKPVFIVSSPRSGSTLLFQTLAQSPDLHTIGGESHGLIEMIPGLHPRDRGWTSNKLGPEDATPEVVREITSRFYLALRDRDGKLPDGGPVTMLEKTPKNSLRVPFLHTIFPDGRFVYLYRDPRETLSSMMEAWTSGGFLTYPRLPDWPGTPWSLVLIPGWQELRGKALVNIVAKQWAETMTILLDDLEALPAKNVCAIAYDAFLAAPQESVGRLCAALEIGWDRTLEATLPPSKTTVSAPAKDKWRRNEAAIKSVWPVVRDVDERARAVLKRFAV